MTRRRGGLLTTVVAFALLVGACSDGPEDAQAALIDAVERTVSEPVAFAFRATADSEALGAMGQDAEAAAAFLRGSEIVGSAAGGDLTATVRLLGAELVRYVRTGATTSLRLGLADVPGLPAELTDPVRVIPLVRQLQLGEDAEAAIVALFQGRWLAVEGELTLDGLREAAGIDADIATDADAPEGVADTIRSYVVIDEVTSGGGRTTYRVSLRLRDLVAALVDPGSPDGDPRLPETLPGTVFVEDGVVTVVRLDITSLTAEDQATAGTVELELELDDHGRAVVRAAPEPTATVSAETFLESVARVLRFVAGVGVG